MRTIHFRTAQVFIPSYTLVLRDISEQFQLRQQILLLLSRFAFDNEPDLNCMLVIERKSWLEVIARKVVLHAVNVSIDELVRVVTSCKGNPLLGNNPYSKNKSRTNQVAKHGIPVPETVARSDSAVF